MRSIRFAGDGQIDIADVADPVAGPGEAVIETRVSALCGSELSAYRGKGMASGNGGHEAAGVVLELGVGVTGLQVGQRIGASAISGCGDCEYCQRGQYTWCADRAFYGSMHAERFVVPAHACHVLADDVPWDAGVLISGDGLGVPYHTSTKLGNGDIDTVAVLGLGPIGLGNVLLETYLGRRVIGIDLKPERTALARTLGAFHTIDAGETPDVPQTVRALTGGRGADVCIEAAGRPETARQCFEAVRTGGTVVFNGEQPSITLSPSEDFIRRDITAFGAWYYHFGEFDEMLSLYRAGLPVTELITHRYPFGMADVAYQEMAAGRTGKVLLEYDVPT